MRSVECRENPCYLSYRANGTDHCQKHDESKWASRTSSDAAERRVRPVQGAASPGAELRLSETRLVPKHQSRPPPRLSCSLSSTSARRERAQQTRYAVMQ